MRHPLNLNHVLISREVSQRHRLVFTVVDGPSDPKATPVGLMGLGEASDGPGETAMLEHASNGS